MSSLEARQAGKLSGGRQGEGGTVEGEGEQPTSRAPGQTEGWPGRQQPTFSTPSTLPKGPCSATGQLLTVHWCVGVNREHWTYSFPECANLAKSPLGWLHESSDDVWLMPGQEQWGICQTNCVLTFGKLRIRVGQGGG